MNRHVNLDVPESLESIILRATKKQFLTEAAKKLGVSTWAARKWIVADKLTPERAMQIAEISEGRVKLSDLYRFVFKPLPKSPAEA